MPRLQQLRRAHPRLRWLILTVCLALLPISFAQAQLGGAPVRVIAVGGSMQSTAIGTPFANALDVFVVDSRNMPVQGVIVTFTAPSAGPSGVFINNMATITAVTNASGRAAVPFTANTKTGGPYTVAAQVTGLSAAFFTLTNSVGPPVSIGTNAGTTPQSVAINTAFTNALAVTVEDADNNRLAGINVAFTAPASGASGVFGNNTGTITVATNASGVAAAPFTANATAGGPYAVTAVVGALASASFTLTNLTTAPGSMTVNASTTPQSATINTAFANVLAVTVRDGSNNPLSGVVVTFSAPASGPSGRFGNNAATMNVATDPSGIATAAFTANATAGPYNVVATVAGLAAVNFALTNIAGAPMSTTVNAGSTPQATAVGTAFGNALGVTVRDASNNLLQGINVTFTAPASGVSGAFGNGTATITVATNASGVASVPFTANAIGGAYLVSAVVNGLTPVTFELTNVRRTFSGNAATGTGTVTVTMTTADGGPGCGFTDTSFAPLESVPLPPPPAVRFPHGLLNLQIGNCVPGATVTLTMQFPQPLPPGTTWWKYGSPGPDRGTPIWYDLDVTNVNGNVVSFTLVDGQIGDDDWTRDGHFSDPGGPAATIIGGPLPAATPVPLLPDWPSRMLLGALVLMLAVGAFTARHRRTR